MIKASEGDIILSAAYPIIGLIGFVKNKKIGNTRKELQHSVLSIIIEFEKNLIRNGVSERTTLAARYCLCTALDEFISLSDCGIRENWSQNSLLSLIHNETWGGERFFIILDSILSDKTQENFQLMKLLYVLLCIGYEGKYYDKNKNEINNLKNKIHYHLCVENDPTQKKEKIVIKNKLIIGKKHLFFLLFFIFFASNVLSYLGTMRNFSLIEHINLSQKEKINER